MLKFDELFRNQEIFISQNLEDPMDPDPKHWK